jgi:predicted SAM-dependent methyltransferase
VLKPNGIIRIIVPDLKATINKYMQGEIPADEVLDELYVAMILLMMARSSKN